MAFDKKSYDINYKKINQKRIYIDVPKELGENFDKKLKENNLSRSDILLPAIKEFLENDERYCSIYESLKESLKEVKEYKKGNIKLKPWQEYKGE